MSNSPICFITPDLDGTEEFDLEEVDPSVLMGQIEALQNLLSAFMITLLGNTRNAK